MHSLQAPCLFNLFQQTPDAVSGEEVSDNDKLVDDTVQDTNAEVASPTVENEDVSADLINRLLRSIIAKFIPSPNYT